MSDATTENSRRSRLLAIDVVRLGASGLTSRPTRAVLSALGIAIGIAAMIAVVGISTSSQARLNAQLSALGTNLLTVEPGKALGGTDSTLPVGATGKVALMAGVERAGSVGTLADTYIYRSRLVDPAQSNSIDVRVAEGELRSLLGATVSQGSWFTAATAQYPTVVLGSIAAMRLGVVSSGSQVWLEGAPFTVIGILDQLPLAPELDSSALVGAAFASQQLGWDGKPTTIYERSADESIPAVRELLPATVNPEHPESVAISRPSDVLAAKNATDVAFTGLLVGLGSVALLVGGIGVANTMVITVLERRREIGLRRALGATRAHIRRQFLAEALVLSALGGAGGSVIGLGVIAVFAATHDLPIAVPPAVFAAGIGATIVIGAIAGLYPAARAAKTPPTSALSG